MPGLWVSMELMVLVQSSVPCTHSLTTSLAPSLAPTSVSPSTVYSLQFTNCSFPLLGSSVDNVVCSSPPHGK